MGRAIPPRRRGPKKPSWVLFLVGASTGALVGAVTRGEEEYPSAAGLGAALDDPRSRRIIEARMLPLAAEFKVSAVRIRESKRSRSRVQ